MRGTVTVQKHFLLWAVAGSLWLGQLAAPSAQGVLDLGG